jgi:hypothetical protein
MRNVFVAAGPRAAVLAVDAAAVLAMSSDVHPAVVDDALAAFASAGETAGAAHVDTVDKTLVFAVRGAGCAAGDADGAAPEPSPPAHAAALLGAAVAIQAAVVRKLQYATAREHAGLRAALHVGADVYDAGGIDSASIDAALVESAVRACPPGPAVLATASAAAALRASELPGLALVPFGADSLASVTPDEPVWRWSFDVFREPAGSAAATRQRTLFGAPLHSPLVRAARPSARAVAAGEARLAAAALALLRGPDGGALAAARVPEAAAAAFVRDVRAAYSADNAFHSWPHAVSVAHATALVLAAPALAAVPPLLRFCILAAALGHDAGHPGTTSSFEIRTHSPIAAAHGGAGPVLERLHAAVTLAALERAGAWAAHEAPARARAVATVDAAIMATDMAVHDAVLATQQARAARCAAGAPVLDGTAADADAFAGEVLHTADLSAAALSAEDMKRWAAALFAEFSSIVERERAAGLPTTPFLDALDGAPLAQARAQVNFVGGVVRPLWVALDTVVGGALDEQLARVDAAADFHRGEAARLEVAARSA